MGLNSCSKRALLVLFGFGVGLATLEFLLSVAALALHLKREQLYASYLPAERTIRILTIGESTTEGRDSREPWPSQLEKLLKKNRPDLQFQVFNRGISAVDSSYIAAHLPEWLDEYEANVVVAMIGINDSGNALVFKREQWLPTILERTRSYKLIRGLVGQFWLDLAERSLSESDARASSPLRIQIASAHAQEPSGAAVQVEAECRDLKRRALAQLELEPGFQVSNAERYEGLLRLAQQCAHMGEKVGALYLIDALIREAKFSEGIFLVAGEIAKYIRDHTAEQYLEQGLREYPESHALRVKLINLLMSDPTNFARVEGEIRHMITEGPTNIENYSLLQKFIEHHRTNCEPYGELFSNLSRQPDSTGMARCLVARFHRYCGNPVLAESAYRNALVAESVQVGVFIQFAAFLGSRSDWHAQKKILVDGTEKFPNSVEIFERLGQAHLINREYSNSIETYVQLITRGLIPLNDDSSLTVRQRALAHLIRWGSTHAPRETMLDFVNWLGDEAPTQNFSKFYYEMIRDLVLERHAILIAMQYPRLKEADLRDLLGDDPRILYVGNENNFEKALEEYRYEDLFVDRFAGTFGHPTDLGNKILAESVARAILNSVLTSPGGTSAP